jgi:hypothetical protein
MRVVFSPYKGGLGGLRRLRAELNAQGVRTKVLKPAKSQHVHQDGDVYMNWGNSRPPLNGSIPSALQINRSESISYVTNKSSAFDHFHANSVPIPDFYRQVITCVSENNLHTGDNQDKVFVLRHKLTGHSAEGVEIINGSELWQRHREFENVRLVTDYIPKKHEYRLHVFRGKVLLIQQKKRRTDVPDEDVDWKIRNYDNGFIYAIDDIVTPDQKVIDAAISACNAVALDYGAVDVIWNQKREKAYVLEINTAPGIVSDTLAGALASAIVSRATVLDSHMSSSMHSKIRQHQVARAASATRPTTPRYTTRPTTGYRIQR